MHEMVGVVVIQSAFLTFTSLAQNEMPTEPTRLTEECHQGPECNANQAN